MGILLVFQPMDPHTILGIMVICPADLLVAQPLQYLRDYVQPPSTPIQAGRVRTATLEIDTLRSGKYFSQECLRVSPGSLSENPDCRSPRGI
jgi:hypothetical protein